MTDPDYADMALKFVEHFLWIASSMTHLGGETGMWDEEDGFFYDVLRLPDGRAERLKVRSMVGLLPLCAATVFDGELVAKYPELGERLQWFLDSPARTVRRDPRPAQARRRRTASSRRSSTRPSSAACWRRCSTRTSSSASSASARCRATTRSTRTSCTSAGRSTASATCRPSPTPACSAATRTGAGRSGCRSTRLIIRALLQYYTLLRRRLHRRVPDRLRPADEPVPGGRGDRPAAGEHLPARTRTAGGRSTAARRSSRTTRTGATSSSSTSTSTATTGPGSGPATRPAGPGSSPGPCTCSRP